MAQRDASGAFWVPVPVKFNNVRMEHVVWIEPMQGHPMIYQRIRRFQWMWGHISRGSEL
jgi:hypothetical protein